MGRTTAVAPPRPAPIRTLDAEQFRIILDGLRRRHGWPEDSQRTMEAAVLGHASRTLRRWIAGERRIPPTLSRLLLAMERDPSLVEALLQYQSEGWPKPPRARRRAA